MRTSWTCTACLLVGLLATGAPAATLPLPPRLVVPPVIYAFPGIETNIYFDNIVLVLNRDNYNFDVACDKGNQFVERWTITPTAEKDPPGDYPMEIKVRDEANQTLATAKSILRILPDAKVEKPMTLLCVGDSLTQAGVYPQHLLDLDAQDPSMQLKLIGCRGADNKPASGPLRFEGYNGWSAESYTTHSGPLARTGEYKRPETGSPFVYVEEDGKPRLDFGKYCQQFNDGQPPDAITILLGSNDVFGASDENIEEQVARMLKNYDMLIEAFRAFGSRTAIGVVIATPPAASQDGFRGYAGPRRLSRWQCKRNNHRLVETMIQRYGGREDEGIYLIPANCNLDTEYGFPTRAILANARATTQVTRITNGSHPSPVGYKQFGDSIYCWLKSLAAAPKQ